MIRFFNVGTRSQMFEATNCQNSEKGFATAEWIVLVGFTIVLLATMVQGLYVENVRQTSFAFLNDAARTGSRVSDVREAIDSPSPVDDDGIKNECLTRLVSSVTQAAPVLDTSTAKCILGVDSSNRVYVEASIRASSKRSMMLPGADVMFDRRLGNLTQRYYPTEAAK